jgi:pyrroline-5-carboxylate reductase
VVEISAKALEEELQVRALKANADVVAAADALVLCVKPQDALSALNELQSKLGGKLVVSIAAGLTLGQLESAAGVNARVVRVMPNTPALVNCGASAYATGSLATEADAHLVEKLFAAVGFVGRVKESLLDAVTGLSGSGPAYGYVLVEALADGGVLMGLPRDLSLKLAAQTLLGAAQMILQTGQHPGTLRDAVTSPGGTTIAGIEALEGAGVRAAMISAVRAATERAQALGKASA